MIQLIPIARLIAVVSVAYAAAIIAGLSLVPDGPLYGEGAWPFRLAFAGSTAVYLLVLFMLSFGWRAAWCVLPQLNRWVFPDINGDWKGEVHFVFEEKSGVVPVDVRINQSFSGISLHVESARSVSETLVVTPEKNGHRISRLRYSFLNIPKHVNNNQPTSYEGSATLDIEHSNLNRMAGNYFTASGSRGRFEFWREEREGLVLLWRAMIVGAALILLSFVAWIALS